MPRIVNNGIQKTENEKKKNVFIYTYDILDFYHIRYFKILEQKTKKKNSTKTYSFRKTIEIVGDHHRVSLNYLLP